jgi:predicted outer membrane repeat protein
VVSHPTILENNQATEDGGGLYVNDYAVADPSLINMEISNNIILQENTMRTMMCIC